MLGHPRHLMRRQTDSEAFCCLQLYKIKFSQFRTNDKIRNTKRSPALQTGESDVRPTLLLVFPKFLIKARLQIFLLLG